MARELAAAESAAVYGRIGTTTQEFGTLASWLVDVLNVLTGNLDRPGGAMFPRAAAGQRNSAGAPGRGRGATIGRWRSRVRGLPESFGELPAAALAEEIETPGEGQVRALFTLAGNPARSTPNSGRIEAALESLDLYVAVDIYVNETTRHADVILPVPSPLERSHYDLAFYQLSIRNVANYSPPVLEPRRSPTSGSRCCGWPRSPPASRCRDDVEPLDRLVAGELLRREVGSEHSPVHGRDVDELLAELEPRRGPERLLDILLRCGPYGDGFGARADGLTLAALEAAPHGIDLGPLEPRLPEALRTPSGRIELAPEPIAADVERLRAALARERDDDEIVLVGRRQLRSNNSWMHNLELLVSGPERCTLHVHPRDAERLGLADGEPARVTQPRRRAGGDGRGDRRGDAGRRLAPARLGPRRAGRAARGRGRARRRELERARRRAARRRALRQRRAQRHPGRRGAGARADRRVSAPDFEALGLLDGLEGRARESRLELLRGSTRTASASRRCRPRRPRGGSRCCPRSTRSAGSGR